MLEMLLGPKNAEKRPWMMLFIGFLFASVSMGMVHWIFSSDAVLSKYSGVLVVTFTVMFSMPFMYYLIKNEEEKDIKYEGFFRILKEHSKALLALLFLFIGFVLAYSFWLILLNANQSFDAQIRTYCYINRPADVDKCAVEYGIQGVSKSTGFSTSTDRIFAIFSNNMYVLIFTLFFSLIFGAGAIFVLAWNASVIAAAISIFAKSSISQIPIGLARYMIHGIPEIAAYFVGALAGGVIGVAIIRHDAKSERFWGILQDSLNLIILAVAILFIAALIEVFITPLLF